MMNHIGKCIVAGGVRRSSEISLGSPDDLAFIGMKLDEEKLSSHRWASNNSIIIDSEFRDFERIASAISTNGEPGIFNLELARSRGRLIDEDVDPRNEMVEGVNPCGETVLENGAACTLAECYPAIVERKGYDMECILRIALRYTKRVTCAKYDWPISRKVIEGHRRVGVSLSGLYDLMTARKVRLLEELSPELDTWYKIVKDEDEKYSTALKVPTSVAITTVKPAGSVSLLSGSSPGMHAHQSRWYIRRIRFQKNDPLLDLLKECGFHIEEDAYSPNTMVVEFPIEAPGAHEKNFRGVGDLTIEEQFENQATLQRWWSDNSVSATITFCPREKRKIAQLLREHISELKCTTLLPYTEPGEKTSYKQMPYEPITEECYKEMSAQIKRWPHEAAKDLNEQKDEEYNVVELDDCQGGACPIR